MGLIRAYWEDLALEAGPEPCGRSDVPTPWLPLRSPVIS